MENTVPLPKLLMLMRHAKSDWAIAEQSDHSRPLNSRGRNSADWMASWISSEFQVPDVILCSSSKRTRETVERMTAIWNADIDLRFCDELYHAAAPQILRQISLKGRDAKNLLVVGHNPGMEILVCELSGKSFAFPTAAVAVFSLTPQCSEFNISNASDVNLEKLTKPRELDRRL